MIFISIFICWFGISQQVMFKFTKHWIPLLSGWILFLSVLHCTLLNKNICSALELCAAMLNINWYKVMSLQQWVKLWVYIWIHFLKSIHLLLISQFVIVTIWDIFVYNFFLTMSTGQTALNPFYLFCSLKYAQFPQKFDLAVLISNYRTNVYILYDLHTG